MKLKKLLKNIDHVDVRGSKDIEITGLSANSKTVVPGHLFLAKKGLKVDGSDFIEEAVTTGAVAVLTDMYNPFLQGVVQLITPNVAAVEGSLASAFYDHPSHQLFVVGITGTSGKTSTSYMIRHMLDQCNELCGLVGTVEWIVGSQVFPSTMTTPDAITNHKLLREMKDQGCSCCVMEVSSHALHQKRVNQISFDTAVFTNLSRDHLDYHTDMADYASAKALLFSDSPDLKVAVINADDPFSEIMTKNCKANIFTYGIDCDADLMAKEIDFNPSGTRFSVCYKQEEELFSTSLIGKFNVYNLLAACAVGITKGYSLKVALNALSTFNGVPGRLQKVPNSKGLHVFVDFAHKPDALANVLSTLQQMKKGKLICLFGCGGNRDRGKRSFMGSIAEKYCDQIILTSDNPRLEDPMQILNDILQGIQDPSKVLIEQDRSEAIRKAIERIGMEDVLLIAGKGHESYQLFAYGKVEFDDRLVAQRHCNDLLLH